ncbi:MAG: nicotinate-nucleotide adenylyltransferase [Geminicoccaceae bacterium]
MSGLSAPPSHRRPVARLQPPPAAATTTAARSEGKRLRVGLLGGSFNPAHDGHRYISLEALRRLRLDQVWWLVSPQNPLKQRAGMAPLAERVAGAARVARHPRLRVLPLETRLGTRYTVDTLLRLADWPDHRFVWLMGADNLAQLHRWRQWHRIVGACAIAVFERHPYSHSALAAPAAEVFAGARLPEARLAELADAEPPAWAFIRLRPHPASATAIRARAAQVRG